MAYGDLNEDYHLNPFASRKRRVGPVGRLETYIKQAEYLSEKISELVELEGKFGCNDDYPVDSVLFWKRRFNRGDRSYTYAAVKVDDSSWYITGRNSFGYAFDTLVEHHLSHADEVWFATKWERQD